MKELDAEALINFSGRPQISLRNCHRLDLLLAECFACDCNQMSDSDSRIPNGAEAANQVSTPETGTLSVVKGGDGGLKVYKPTDALEEIGASGIRGNGGMVVLGTLVKLLQDQLQSSERRAQLLEHRLETLQTKHNEKSELCAVQQNEIENARRLKLAQSALLSAGGLFNGIGVKYLMDEKPGGGAWLAAGIILSFVGWLWPFGTKPKQQQK